jgi:hypothetical protein
MLWLFMLLLLAKAWAQQPIPPTPSATCDYTTAPATVSLTASNVPGSPFITLYLLVDMTTGMIAQVNATNPVFAGVGRGSYYVVAAHYKAALINAQAGKRIADVYATDQCLSYGTAVHVKVCPAVDPCDAITAPANLSFTVASLPGSYTTTYALVNTATNQIVQTSSSPAFAGVAVGEYAAVAVHHTGSLTALTAGISVYAAVNNSENCLSVSNAIYYKVCNNPVGAFACTNAAISANFVANGTPGQTGTLSLSITTTTPGAITLTTSLGAGAVGIFSVPTTFNTTLTAGQTLLTIPLEYTGAGSPVVASVFIMSGQVTGTCSATTLVSAPVLPPSVVINGPGNTTATTTPTIAGTATPGSIVTITDPTGATLCSTTATAAGSWSCAVNVPAGPTTLTATACNSAGCATTTTNFTALGPISCLSATVGGSVVYNGGALCPGQNAGTVSLTGQVGTVVTWESFSFGNPTWTAIPNTAGLTHLNFFNAPNGQQYRAIVEQPSPCAAAFSNPVMLPFSSAACSSTVCDNSAGQIVVNISSGTLAAGQQQVLVATNATGTIQYIGATGASSITGVANADYYVYLVTYDPSVAPAPNLTVGTLLSNVGGGCVKYSNQMAYKVCPPVVLPTVVINGPGNTTATTSPVIAGTATPGAIVTLTDPTGLRFAARRLRRAARGVAR